MSLRYVFLRSAGLRFRPVAWLPASVSIASVRANSSVNADSAGESGDFDGDGIPELPLRFDRTALMATLPEVGSGQVVLTGLSGALEFEAVAEVEIIDKSEPDTDRDGTPDTADTCPDTADGDTPLRDGCSADQVCPCALDLAGVEWESHRHYVRCVFKEAAAAQRSRAIDKPYRRELRREAARSTCGALCPDLSAGDVQAVWVCIEQRCPCDGPEPGVEWSSASHFLRCVREQAHVADHAGLIGYDERKSFLREAKSSGCGVRRMAK